VPRIYLETFIAAPVERCFDMMRDVEAHTRSVANTRERAVAGKTSGLLDAGHEVTWEAVHLGLRQRLSVRVTRCEPPYFLQDEMLRGAFRSFVHRHRFHEAPGGTLMSDDFTYRSPLGLVGRLADRLFLERYMRRFLIQRARALKAIAENCPNSPTSMSPVMGDAPDLA